MTLTEQQLAEAVEARRVGYHQGASGAGSHSHGSCLAAALTAALPIIEPQWQPIETAPKDGRYIWGFRPSDEASDEQGIFWWREDRHGAYWTNAADDYNGDPTHWMPLPASPSILALAEEARG